ncbi:hypothetical protein TNCT_363681 [Trichonephila clavata]|uniref:Uncharacterized protein n=1 Tax=Trichonephila clavata TaxID=2740835 RepID=A0A8X6GTT1_TRICU|nr:hypothetical protein TNCT_363681 [Trichonephila clavata]
MGRSVFLSYRRGQPIAIVQGVEKLGRRKREGSKFLECQCGQRDFSTCELPLIRQLALLVPKSIFIEILQNLQDINQNLRMYFHINQDN